MAATVFYNVTNLSINSVVVLEETSIDISGGASVTQNTVDGGAYASILSRGSQTLSATANAMDPGTNTAGILGAVLGTSGACSWDMTKDCNESGTATFTLADGTPERMVAESFEFDSGGPGETGTASGTFQLVGMLNDGQDEWKTAYEDD